MPVIRAGTRLIFFAHVPKCGGQSMDIYLQRRFGPLGLWDPGFLRRGAAARATPVSPQHLSGVQVAALFPEGLFDAQFALVRHPVARILSEYHYDIRLRGLSPAPAFCDWLRAAHALARADPTAHDHHLLPQTAFLPPGDVALFPLEGGMAPVVAWLDEVTGTTAPDVTVPHANVGRRPAEGAAADLVGEAELSLIAEWFAGDFQRFGYAPGLPAAPVAAMQPAPRPWLGGVRNWWRARHARRRRRL